MRRARRLLVDPSTALVLVDGSEGKKKERKERRKKNAERRQLWVLTYIDRERRRLGWGRRSPGGILSADLRFPDQSASSVVSIPSLTR